MSYKKKKKLKHLQETSVEHTTLNTTEASTSKSKNISKNQSTATILNDSQQENINLFIVINFVEQAMQTLTNYAEQLATQWTSNLSNKSFTKDVYKLLNKNLNSVPTQKTFDKKTFDKEINDFYRRSISLKAKHSKSHPVSPGSLQKTNIR